MSLITTVSDAFGVTQKSEDPAKPYHPPPLGWTPVNSIRSFIVNFNSSSDINDTIANKWFYNLGGDGIGGLVDLFYSREEGSGTTYDLSRLLTINVENVSLNSGNGEITVALGDENDKSAFQSFPIKDSGTHTYTFPLSFYEQENVDTTRITFILVRINNNAIFTRSTGSASGISFTLICVAKDTMIHMANGTKKAIQDIQRGDMVVGGGGSKIFNRVARVINTKLPGATPISLVTIEKDAIAKNRPYTKLIMSSSHPILYDGARRPAQRFRKFPGITYYGKKGTIASDVLPPNEDGTYSLYNLQYEHDGYFVANGVTVDSVPVMSSLAPLPKELFFDQELYNKPSTVKVAPLDKDFVKPPKRKVRV